jgi:hypothetical protein
MLSEKKKKFKSALFDINTAQHSNSLPLINIVLIFLSIKENVTLILKQ